MKQTVSHRRPFGKGTLATVIGLAGFALYSFWSKPTQPESSYFEADRSGRLARVAQPRSNEPLKPLWKPEPGFLLLHDTELKLTAEQTRQIRKASNQWLADKSRLVDEMDHETGSLQPSAGRGLSVTAVQTNLEGYSELSRAYDRLRSVAWAQAMAVLGPQQQAQVDQLRLKGGRS